VQCSAVSLHSASMHSMVFFGMSPPSLLGLQPGQLKRIDLGADSPTSDLT
jgi:hypothetical protein